MKKVDKLDNNIFNDSSKSVSIGIIDNKLITLIKGLNPNIAQHMIAGTNIIFGKIVLNIFKSIFRILTLQNNLNNVLKIFHL